MADILLEVEDGGMKLSSNLEDHNDDVIRVIYNFIQECLRQHKENAVIDNFEKR